MRLMFRLLSFFVLCLGVVAASIDSIASVSASQPLMTSIEASWDTFFPGSLPALQNLIESELGAGARLAFANLLLPQPAFGALFVLALLLWMIGYRKPSPAGRFAA